MNKVAFTIAFVVASFAAVTYAGPVAAPKAVSWDAVNATVSQVEATIRNGTQEIKDIALASNIQLGNAIAAKIDASAVNATEILGQANADVANQTLTEEKGREYFGNLRGILAGLVQSIQDEVNQLPIETAIEIKEVYLDVERKVEALANLIYALLAL